MKLKRQEYETTKKGNIKQKILEICKPIIKLRLIKILVGFEVGQVQCFCERWDKK